MSCDSKTNIDREIELDQRQKQIILEMQSNLAKALRDGSNRMPMSDYKRERIEANHIGQYNKRFIKACKDIGIYGDYWSSAFWSDILDSEDTHISLPFVPNRLRKAINDFWGYNEISDEIILKDIFKSKIRYFLSRYIR